jgi:threonine synthase
VTFECAACRSVVEVGPTTWRCPCGGAYSLLEGSTLPPDILARLSMGEGNTPLVEVTLAGRTVLAKLELASPTLSFKDRGAVQVVAAAVALGAERVIADSSGNAGTAMAAYAARAGLGCEVFVASSTSPEKLAQMRAHGASVTLIAGTREDVAAAAVHEVERTGAFYASHVWIPWFFEGTKAYVHELHAQLGGDLPDVLLLPVGNGTLLLGAWTAVRELEVEARVRLMAVQAAACAPIASAFAAGAGAVAPVTNEGTVAEGIAIAAPVRGAEVLAAVRATNGSVVTVTDDEVLAAQSALAAQGLFVEPTAAAPAAAVAYVEADASVAIPLSGAGLKSVRRRRATPGRGR